MLPCLPLTQLLYSHVKGYSLLSSNHTVSRQHDRDTPGPGERHVHGGDAQPSGPSYWTQGPSWLPLGPRCPLVRLGVARPMLPQQEVAKAEDRAARAARLAEARLKRLKHLTPFVLDTTLLEVLDTASEQRTGAFAAVRTAQLLAAVKQTGAAQYVVARYVSGQPVVSPKDLAARGLIDGGCVGWVDLYDSVDHGAPVDELPTGLAALALYGIHNIVLEANVLDRRLDWSDGGSMGGVAGYVRLIERRSRHVVEELARQRQHKAAATHAHADAIAVPNPGAGALAPSLSAQHNDGAAWFSRDSAASSASAVSAAPTLYSRSSSTSGSSTSSANSSRSPSLDQLQGDTPAGTSTAAQLPSTAAAATTSPPAVSVPCAPHHAFTSSGSSPSDPPQAAPASVWVHVAGFTDAMADPSGEGRARVLELVRHVAALPPDVRPVGLMFQDATGSLLHFEMSPWAAAVRRAMVAGGWPTGQLLVRAAHGYGMAEAAVIECLASGCSGVWAGACDEGPATGQCSSLVTLVNLARLGNPHVPRLYDLPRMRQVAIAATRAATGAPPHARTEVYGSRALDVCFDTGGMGDDGTAMVAHLLRVPSEVRVSTMLTPQLLVQRLTQTFGDNGGRGFDLARAVAMLEVLHQDLLLGEREEYNSAVGLATLWERSGGQLTPNMVQVVQQQVATAAGAAPAGAGAGAAAAAASGVSAYKTGSSGGGAVDVDEEEVRQTGLLLELRALWDQWAVQEQEMGHTGLPSDCLSYTSFYHGFMGRYFSCFTCDSTREAYSMFTLSGPQGVVSWGQFLLRVRWALAQHGRRIGSVEELLQVVFERLIIPEMLKRVQQRREGRQQQQQLPDPQPQQQQGADQQPQPAPQACAGTAGAAPTSCSMAAGTCGASCSIRLQHQPRWGLQEEGGQEAGGQQQQGGDGQQQGQVGQQGQPVPQACDSTVGAAPPSCSFAKSASGTCGASCSLSLQHRPRWGLQEAGQRGQEAVRQQQQGGGGQQQGQGLQLPPVPMELLEGVDGRLTRQLHKAVSVRRDELYEEWKREEIAGKQVGVNIKVLEII